MVDHPFTTTDDLLMQVMYLTDEGRLLAALPLAKRAVALDPKNLPAVLQLMNVHTDMERPDLAIAVAEEALRLGVNEAILHVSISGYRRKLGDLGGAEAAAIEAMALAPGEAMPRIALALAREDQERPEEALELLRGAAELPDSGIALARMIRIADELDRHEEVVSACKTYLRRYGRDAETLGFMGRAYLCLGDLRRAERAFRSGIEEAPDSVAAHRSLVVFFLASKNEEAAKRHLGALSFSNPDLGKVVLEEIMKFMAAIKEKGELEPEPG